MPETGMKWNLDDILPVDKFSKLHSEIEEEIKKINEFYELLAPEMEEKDFKRYMEFNENLGKKLSRLRVMPELMQAADQKSQKARELNDKATDLALKYSKESRKIEHWIQGKKIQGKKQLDENNAKRLFSSVPALTYVLSHLRRSESYTLQEREEEIISNKNRSGSLVLTKLRDLIETEFSFEFQPDKTRKPQLIKTSSELHAFRTSQDPKEREESYVTELKKYKENIDKFFIIYQAIVKDWVFESNLRGYNSSISMRNFENHIPDKAIETLLEVCSENIDIFHRYFKFKAKELGMKKLRRFDVYSHIKKKEKKISFNDAKKLVLDTFEKFSPSFAEKARKIINANHIDSHPSSVKVGGAFCYTIAPDIIPYVFLNYNGTLREVATLAHELGHGIHSLFASHQSFSSQHANLPLCETASTFGEMILFERLFAEAESDEEKKSMLSDKLAESYGSIIRQNYFIKFEILAHEAIKKGTNLEELSELYFKTLKEQFGDSLEIDPLFRYEWAYISHIVHSPFYCYAYNFGELLSMALYSRYKKEGPSFIPKIEKILAYGGSKNPQEVLKEIGIDITSKEFWQGSFELIRGWQDQLEGL